MIDHETLLEKYVRHVLTETKTTAIDRLDPASFSREEAAHLNAIHDRVTTEEEEEAQAWTASHR